MGREIKVFSISSQPAGYNEITWDGSSANGELVSSGVYIYRLKFKATGSMQAIEKTAKLILTK